MKTIEFRDKNFNMLRIQHSSSVDPSYRIYIKFADDNGQIPESNAWGHCLHLNQSQTEILINALQDLMNDNA